MERGQVYITHLSIPTSQGLAAVKVSRCFLNGEICKWFHVLSYTSRNGKNRGRGSPGKPTDPEYEGQEFTKGKFGSKMETGCVQRKSNLNKTELSRKEAEVESLAERGPRQSRGQAQGSRPIPGPAHPAISLQGVSTIVRTIHNQHMNTQKLGQVKIEMLITPQIPHPEINLANIWWIQLQQADIFLYIYTNRQLDREKEIICKTLDLIPGLLNQNLWGDMALTLHFYSRVNGVVCSQWSRSPWTRVWELA